MSSAAWLAGAPRSRTLVRRAAPWIAVAAGYVIVAVAALVVLRPRGWVPMPSLIDDWVGAAAPAQSAGTLLHGFIEVPTQRFRPSWDAFYNVVWHGYGAPYAMTLPFAADLVRGWLFLAGATLVPGAVVAARRVRPHPVELCLLTALPGLLILGARGTDIDLVRLGPQEPLLFGAMALGLALVVAGAGRVLRSARPSWSAGALLAAGWLLWLFGVYHKEASVVVVVLAPFLYLHLDRGWRADGTLEGPLWRAWPARIAALALALPVLHVAAVLTQVSSQGVAIYGATPPSSVGGWLVRAWDALSVEWRAMADGVGTAAWNVVAVAVPLLTMWAGVRRSRVPWLAMGLILTGWAALVFQGITLEPETRYYLPTIALFAAAAILVLADAGRWVRGAALVAIAVAVCLGLPGGIHDTQVWAAVERDNDTAVQLARDLHPASCHVYTARLDLERAEAFPLVVGLTHQPLSGPCHEGAEAVLVAPRAAPAGLQDVSNERILAACRPPGWEQFAGTNLWTVMACAQVRHGTVGGQRAGDVLRQDRLIAGVGRRASLARCAQQRGAARCSLGAS